MNGVIQLTHITRPGIPLQASLGVKRQAHWRMLHFIDVTGQQSLSQRQNIGTAFTQWLPGQREHRQAIEQVFTETPGRHLTGQVPVGGGDDTDIQGNRLTPPNPLHFPLLQNPQQLGL
ncbi:hypothetical protein D3C84_1084990 [compost metagenome]